MAIRAVRTMLPLLLPFLVTAGACAGSQPPPPEPPPDPVADPPDEVGPTETVSEAEVPPAGPIDGDGDGLDDTADRCPTVAEDRDGHADDDGCVDLDDDGDGVADGADQCQAEPEQINGVTDDDGCPDRGGRVLWRAGEVDHCRPTLRGRVRFSRDHAIDPASAESMAQLARHLQTAAFHGDAVILLGATDRARAAALRTALVSSGVPAESFRIEGRRRQGDRVIVQGAADPLCGLEGNGHPARDPGPDAIQLED